MTRSRAAEKRGCLTCTHSVAVEVCYGGVDTGIRVGCIWAGDSVHG
jgi:hypothetical protein